MRTPSKTSTRYDLLDSMRDGAVWSINTLSDDTGRTKPTVQSSAAAMHTKGHVVYRRRSETGTGSSEITITDAGRRWLWFCDRDLPGQGADILTLLLLALEDGPALTSQVSARAGDYSATRRTKSALAVLQNCGAVRIRLQYEYGLHKPARVSITETGREILREMREARCFDVWLDRSSRRLGLQPDEDERRTE